ncbi:MAG: hypothetical protein AB7F75_01300 [Planctomycetota bacterium]
MSGNDLEQKIEENAKNPKRARGDSGEVEAHPLPDQIAADRYLNSKKAVKSKGLGIKVSKLVHPGAS